MNKIDHLEPGASYSLAVGVVIWALAIRSGGGDVLY